jgi:hypothetical protein
VRGGVPDRRMEGTGGIAVQAPEAVRHMTPMPIYPYQGELPETFQTCRYLF